MGLSTLWESHRYIIINYASDSIQTFPVSLLMFVLKRKTLDKSEYSFFFFFPSLPSQFLCQLCIRFLLLSETSKWRVPPVRLYLVVIHCHIQVHNSHSSLETTLKLSASCSVRNSAELKCSYSVKKKKRKQLSFFFSFLFFFPKSLKWDTVLVEWETKMLGNKVWTAF